MLVYWVLPGKSYGVILQDANCCVVLQSGHSEEAAARNGCSRLVILLPEPIQPSSASAKLTQGGKLAVFTSLAT